MNNTGEIYNGDTRVILERIDALGKLLQEQKTRQGQYHQESQRKFELMQEQTQEMKMQTALLQQSHDAICLQVAENEEKIDRNDFWTKILGAITGILILVGSLVAVINQLLAAR